MEKYYLYINIRIFLFGKKIELLDKIASLLINKLVEKCNNYYVELDELKRELENLKNE